MLSFSRSGSTHSFLPQTPEPYGHCVDLYRSSKSFFHSRPSRRLSDVMSCFTSSSERHALQRSTTDLIAYPAPPSLHWNQELSGFPACISPPRYEDIIERGSRPQWRAGERGA